MTGNLVLELEAILRWKVASNCILLHQFFLLELYFPVTPRKKIEQLLPLSRNLTFQYINSQFKPSHSLDLVRLAGDRHT